MVTDVSMVRETATVWWKEVSEERRRVRTEEKQREKTKERGRIKEKGQEGS